MAEDTKAEELIEELRAAFAANIRTAAAGVPAHVALQMADALCQIQMEMLAGKRVRYKSVRAVDGAAIEEDWRRGATLEEIMALHHCSRRTAYNYHPSKGHRRRA